MLKIGVITMALMSFLHAGWFGDLFDSTPTPPFRVYVDLGQTSYVAEKKFKITEDKTYVLGLSYSTTYEKAQADPSERTIVDKILFGFYRAEEDWISVPRTKIPIKITISGVEKQKKPFVFEEVYLTNKGLKAETFSMDLGLIELVEGSYKIKIEIVDGVPELAGIPMYIRVGNIRKLK